MKLVTKYLICYGITPPGSWSQFLATKQEFDSEEEAIEKLENFSKEIRGDYYIVQVKRFEK